MSNNPHPKLRRALYDMVISDYDVSVNEEATSDRENLAFTILSKDNQN